MKYCFFFTYGSIDRYIFKDLMDLDNVNTVFLNKPENSRIRALARRVHRSEKINSYVNFPWKSCWENLDEINHLAEECECLVFTSIALAQLDWSYLRKAKKNGHKMILIIYDSLAGHSHHLNAVKRYIFNFSWDLIMSFDEVDCSKYGFKSIDFAMYSMLPCIPSENVSDIYFIGKNKAGRNDRVEDLYKTLKGKVLCNFNLKRIERLHPKKADEWKDGIHIFYNRSIKYEQVLSDVLSTNVILEYLHEGQQAQSLRYYEAVCYNKKLLTNNKNIIKLPFYDERYMKVFSSHDDIDIDWIKEKENIDYGYAGEFSPLGLLRIIESNNT